MTPRDLIPTRNPSNRRVGNGAAEDPTWSVPHITMKLLIGILALGATGLLALVASFYNQSLLLARVDEKASDIQKHVGMIETKQVADEGTQQGLAAQVNLMQGQLNSKSTR